MDRRRPRSLRPVVINELSGVLIAGLKRALRNEPIKPATRKRLREMGLIKKNPNGFSQLSDDGLRILQRITKPQEAGR